MAAKLLCNIVSYVDATAPNTRVDVFWLTSDTLTGGNLSINTDLNGTAATARDVIHAAIVADANTATGRGFVAADIVGMDELVSQKFGLVPISVTFSALLAQDDLARVQIPSILNHPNVQIDSVAWSMSARALLSGTATLVVKNNAGTTLATRAITAAGVFAFTPTVSTIAAGDTLRFGFSGIGLGLSDVSVTGWLRVPLGV